MRFSIAIPALTVTSNRAWSAIIERMARTGYDGVQIDVPDVPDVQTFREMARRLSHFGLVATVNGDHNEFESERHVSSLLDGCALLDAHVLTGPFSLDGVGLDFLALERLSEQAAEMGVVIALSGRGASGGTAKILHRLESVGSAVGISYDTNQAHTTESSVSSAILSAGARLRHVLIADNDGALPGAGQVRWAETFASLAAIRYAGWYVVDVKPGETNEQVAGPGLELLRRNIVPLVP
jgi:D-psicose/D-tagatose/L-ribulose 3-epimerase